MNVTQPVTRACAVNFPLHNPSLFEHFEMLAYCDRQVQNLVEKLKLPQNYDSYQQMQLSQRHLVSDVVPQTNARSSTSWMWSLPLVF
jgi:hypothetical protein